MITIGPWWLWDFIDFVILVSLTAFGMRRGAFAALYFFLFQIGTIIVISFIPQLLTNATESGFYALLVKLHFMEALNGMNEGLSESLGGAIGKVWSKLNGVTLDFTNITDETVRTISSLVLFSIWYGGLYSILFLSMFIIYFTNAHRFKAAKLNKTVNYSLGGIFGLLLALSNTAVISTILSSPILDYSSQKVSFPPYGIESKDFANEMKHKIKYGNQYVENGITSNVSRVLPNLPVSYSATCISKYIVNPLVAIAYSQTQAITGATRDVNTDKISEAASIFEDLIVDGYATDNFFKYPIKSCIEALPNYSKNVARFTSELVLFLSHFTNNMTNNSQNYDDSKPTHEIDGVNLRHQMDEFFKQHIKQKTTEWMKKVSQNFIQH